MAFVQPPVNFTPLHDNILIKAEEPPKRTGTILLPDSASTKRNIGRVVRCGPGPYQSGDVTLSTPYDFGVGALVLFDHYASTELEIDGEKFLLVKYCNILGMLEPLKVELDANGRVVKALSKQGV